MKEIALHLLDLAENSVSAGASAIEITVDEDFIADRLSVMVTDNGKGLDPEIASQLGDPFYTTRTTRNVGLGIPLFQAAAEACNGALAVTSETGKGTAIQADFQHSHIDRMPLGDLAGTALALLIAHPEVNWRFIYRCQPGEASSPSETSQPEEFFFDDAPIKAILDGVPFTDPDVLGYLRQTLHDGVAGVASSVLTSRQSHPA